MKKRTLVTVTVLALAAVALAFAASASAGFCTEQPDIVCGTRCMSLNGWVNCYYWPEPESFCIYVYPGCLGGAYHCSCGGLDGFSF